MSAAHGAAAGREGLSRAGGAVGAGGRRRRGVVLFARSGLFEPFRPAERGELLIFFLMTGGRFLDCFRMGAGRVSERTLSTCYLAGQFRSLWRARKWRASSSWSCLVG